MLSSHTPKMAMLLHEPSLVPPVGIGGNPQLRGASAVDVSVKPTILSASISSDSIVLELMSAWGAPMEVVEFWST